MQAWQATVQDEQGNVVFNPSITVYVGTGSTLATIYNENGTVKPNPFIGSVEGFVQFWANPGKYRIVGASGAEQTQTWHWENRGKKIFILATGQSNMRRQLAYSFTPAQNVRVWNNPQNNTAGVGTAFARPSGSLISTSISYANKIAIDNPDYEVYLLNCARGGQPIQSWMPGAAPDVDVYADIASNIGPAMAAAGVSRVDQLLWWQGENGGSYSTYPSDFESVMDRFASNVWFDKATPMIIFGVAPSSMSGSPTYDLTNFALQELAAKFGNYRKFVKTSVLSASNLWEDAIHMNAEGYWQVGVMAARAADGKSDYIPDRLQGTAPLLNNANAPTLGTGVYRTNTETTGVAMQTGSLLRHEYYTENFAVQEQAAMAINVRWRRYKRLGTWRPWFVVAGSIIANADGGAAQDVVGTDVTNITFSNEVNDPLGLFNGTTFTLPQGAWHVDAAVRVGSGAATDETISLLVRNAATGTTFLGSQIDNSAGSSIGAYVGGIILADGATTYAVSMVGNRAGTKSIQQHAALTYLHITAVDAGYF